MTLLAAQEQNDDASVKVEQRPIHSDEVYSAKEAFLIGSTKLAMPITRWNGKPISDGKPGSFAASFKHLLEKDREPWQGSSQHIKFIS
jgi:branched-subunit amino acid aminotransferase/4-amino-4-deoxychorismate lyase